MGDLASRRCSNICDRISIFRSDHYIGTKGRHEPAAFLDKPTACGTAIRIVPQTCGGVEKVVFMVSGHIPLLLAAMATNIAILN
jgi:hypothetical protein